MCATKSRHRRPKLDRVGSGAPGSLVGNGSIDPERRQTVRDPHAIRHRLFGRGAWSEASRIADILRRETISGVLLLAAALLALVWANSPWSGAYEAIRDAQIGPAWAHL